MNARALLYSSLVIVSAFASAACGVSQVTYDQAVRDAAVARAEAEQAKADARRAIGTSAGAAEFQKQATELEDLREKLTDANARVATIQSAEEAASAKAALYQELATQLHNMAQGVKQDALSAAGYADVDPVAPNSTTEGRAKNRRTEITVQPNIDEFVRVPHE